MILPSLNNLSCFVLFWFFYLQHISSGGHDRGRTDAGLIAEEISDLQVGMGSCGPSVKSRMIQRVLFVFLGASAALQRANRRPQRK